MGELEIIFPKSLPSSPLSLPALPTKILSKSKQSEIKSRRDKTLKIVNALRESYYYGTDGNGDNTITAEPFPKLLAIRIDYLLPSRPTEGIVFRRRCESANEEYACMYTLSQGPSSVPSRDPHGVRCWLPCFDTPTQRPLFDLTVRAPEYCSVQCSGTLIDSQASASASDRPYKILRYLTINRITASALGLFVGRAEQYSLPLYRVVGKVWVARGLVDYVKSMHIKPATLPSTAASSGTKPVLTTEARRHESDGQPHAKRMRTDSEGGEAEAAFPQDPDAGVEVDGLRDIGDEEDDDESEVSTVGHALGRLYRDLVRHKTLGLDLATRVVHKLTQRRFEHSHYCQVSHCNPCSYILSYLHPSQIFVPQLEEDCLCFDGFSLLDARFLVGPEQVAQETSSHLMQLAAYLTSWLCTGSCLPVAPDCAFLPSGMVAALVRAYCESIFGDDHGALLQQRALDTVVTLEKMGFSYPLHDAYFPESVDRFLPYFAQYHSAKAAWLMHMLYTRLGGRESFTRVFQAFIRAPLLVPPPPSGPQAPLTQGMIHRHNVASAYKRSGGGPEASYSFAQDEQFSASLAFLGLMPSPGHSSDPGSPFLDRYSDLASPSYPYASNSIGMYSPGRSESASPNPYLTSSAASPNPYLMSVASPNPYAQPAASPNPYAQSVASPNPYAVMASPNPYSYIQPSPNPYASSSSAGVHPDQSPRSRSRSNSLDLATKAAVERDADSFPIPSALPVNMRSTLVRQASITSESGASVASVDQAVGEGQAMTLESFLSAAQVVTSADADLDEAFADRYISDSGVSLVRFGLFIGPKIEGKPQTMTLLTDCVPVRHGKLALKPSAFSSSSLVDLTRQEVKARVLEVRDDMMTEPTLRLTAGVEEMHQQHLFTKPGRRGGRKKTHGEDDIAPAQLALQARLEAEREANKDVLELARGREEPVRYAILDPACSYILGEVNIMSSDASLVEQLYTETDGSDLLRHIQAIRSLARVSPLSYPPSVAHLAPKPNATNIKRDNSFRVRALIDVILCNPVSAGTHNQGGIVQAGHSLFTRIEAVFALSQWQVRYSLYRSRIMYICIK